MKTLSILKCCVVAVPFTPSVYFLVNYSVHTRPYHELIISSGSEVLTAKQPTNVTESAPPVLLT